MNDKCTMCGEEGLVKLSSQNAKVCTGCGHEEAWPLEAGQQPLVGSHRQKSPYEYQGKLPMSPACEKAMDERRRIAEELSLAAPTTMAAARVRDGAELLTEAERAALVAANGAALEGLIGKPEELRKSDETEELDHVFRAIQVFGQTGDPTIMKRVDCLTDIQRNLFAHKLDRLLQHIAPDDSMFRNYQAELRSLSNTIAATHTCYEKGDEGCPEQILDRNGDVVLGLCKHCGAGESELTQQVCTGPKPTESTLKIDMIAAHDQMEQYRKTLGLHLDAILSVEPAPLIDPDHIRRSYRFADVCEANYLQLALVLQRAHDQAAYGKGKDRHAKGQPFHEQRMQSVSRLLDSPDGMAYQVLKKVTEGLELPTTERKVAELLGAINYLAGIVIFLESKDRASAVNIIAGEV